MNIEITERPQSEANPFAEWVVLELMGHRRLAGYLAWGGADGGPF